MIEAAQYPGLKDKTVYITGGATGIGAALVRAFCAQGAQVVLNDILAEKAEVLVQEVGAGVRFDKVDVADIQALQKSIAKHEKLDVLINNVANDQRHDPLEIDPDAWRKLMAVNLDAAFFAAQSALKTMIKAGEGSIINLSSINARITPQDMPAYVAAKAGIDALSKALAKQYGPQGVRVNTIVPGWIATERQLETWLTPEIEAEWQKTLALPGRILPDDVAKLALFLASNDSAKITGQRFVIDGGRT